MGRIDVAGNRVGTQTPYTAYGINGQVRVLIEGINTTEAQGFAGFYFDYGSFEESFIGTSAQTAEMPHPGVQSSFIGRSGGNQFAGEYYLDWYNNSLQGSNIPDEYRRPLPSTTARFSLTATKSRATTTPTSTSEVRSSATNCRPMDKPRNRLKFNPLPLQRPVDAGDNCLERRDDNVLVDADAEQR